HTMRLNPGMMITIVPIALSNRTRKMRLTMDLESSNHLVEYESDGPFEIVDTTSLDEYLYSRHLRHVTFVKIDAEGFDLQVLEGAEQLLVRERPALMVETWGPPTIRDWLEERGYRTYRYAFETRTLYEYPRPFLDQANVIAVHEDELEKVRR